MGAPATTSPMRPPGSWGAKTCSNACPTTAGASDWSETQHVESCAKPEADGRSTVMLRNLPSFFTRDMLVELLDSVGCVGTYDFVHLPLDMSRLSCLGFGFVNFTTHGGALHFFKVAQGFQGWQRQSNKILDVSWSNPLQGLAAQVQRYRNSNIMHPSVPEQCQPMLFGKDGERIPFPSPTIALRAPRRN